MSTIQLITALATAPMAMTAVGPFDIMCSTVPQASRPAKKQREELISIGTAMAGPKGLDLTPADDARIPFVLMRTAPDRPRRLGLDRSNQVSASSLEFAPVSPAIEALKTLREFKSWTANWDGEGAPAPKAASIEAASNLLGLLDASIHSTPKVTLNSSGEPMFLLIEDDGELSVTIQSRSTIAFYVETNGFEDGGLARFNGRDLPAKLQRSLARAGFIAA